MAEQQEFMVYVNGELVPESKAVISALDRGFRWGDAVYDVERTFNGNLFKLDAHLDRLYRSMHYTRIDPGITWEEMEKATLDTVEANAPLLETYGDFSVSQVVSRGLMNPDLHKGANVVIYCRPITLKNYAKYYVQGVKAATTATRRTPPESLSPKAKISNKMNHLVAEFEVKQADPSMFALMLDLRGNITEGASANFMFVSKGHIKVPNRRNVLAGISMETIIEMAEAQDIPVDEDDYTPFDVYQSDEAFFCTSTACLIPVNSLNGLQLGREVPGPMTKSLFAAFGEMVGVDIVDQAMSHLSPEERQALMAEKKA